MKILLLTNSIPEYRIPLFNLLNRDYDFTVAYFDKAVETERYEFKTIKLSPKRFLSLVFLKEKIASLARNYDVVIYTGDLHFVFIWPLLLNKKRKYALINWGGDVSYSYGRGYDEDRKLDRVRFTVAKFVDACIFYCSYPVHRYVEDGKIEREKLFVANNTVEIADEICIPEKKDNFIFIGTLYKAKKIFELLKAYKAAFELDKNIGRLILVGDGPEKKGVIEFINQYALQDKVVVKGAIYDETELKPLFINSIACISPGQAGLSVLKSLAFGVPFITEKNAITGGERFNIINNYNGFLYDGSIEALTTLLVLLSNAPKYVQTISHNARSYYLEKASMTAMKESFVKAIEYSLSNK